jgi:predicted Zn-dependent protease
MSEALHGGHDSRSAENPLASAGQRAQGTAASQDAGGTALGHECDGEAPVGAHSRPAEGVRGGESGQEVLQGNGGQQGPGGDSYAWYRRGLDLLGRGSPAAAAELLERAAEAEPGARSIREALARAQFDAGRYAQAADNFRQNVEAIPSDDYAHFGLGLALARSGDPAAAAEHLALAAAMRPELAHYTEALRGVRATLAARTEAGAGALAPPAPDGDERR